MATKVPVKLEHAAALSKQLVDRLPPGQAHWWLRGATDFIRLPRRVRGDQPLDQTVQLEPGTYTLGVGPPSNGVRETLVVEAPEEPAAGAEAAPAAALPIEGKTFVLTGDLDAMEHEAAKTWLVGLGAKVSTSVSSKTDYLLVGRDPGPKKVEKATELGTRIVSEAELRASLGLPAAPAPEVAQAAKPGAGGDPLAKFIGKCDLRSLDLAKIGKLVGLSHFRSLGLHEHQLWGISIGPRGGEHAVYIDLLDRPKSAMQCNCSQNRPCQHAYALLLTAQRHAVPPAPPPEGHEAQARHRPTWE